MNHYERLKVSPDAPPEVIRAAYRALAAKLHPDRKPGDSGPGDPMHEDMAALNASYLVLMDAKGRAEYDQWLANEAAVAKAAAEPPPGRFGRGFLRKQASAESGAEAADQATESRVDVDWLSASPASELAWLKEPKWLMALGATMAIALGGVVWVFVQQTQQMKFDSGLSALHAGAAAPSGTPASNWPAPADATVPGEGAPPSAELTPEQLAKMSNDELLAAMPKVIGGAPVVAKPGAAPLASVASVAANQPHLLDGPPLMLNMAPMHLPGKPSK